MDSKIFIRLISRLIALSLIVLGTGTSLAQKQDSKEVFYAGLDMGPSLLYLSSDQDPGKRMARYGLGFFGGYTPVRAIRIGLNLNGYLIESYGNSDIHPGKGISISNTHLQLQYLPFKKNLCFVNVQGGWSQYINHHPDEYNSKGFSGKAGLGYYYSPGQKLFISVQLNYGIGKYRDIIYPGIKVTNRHFNTMELAVGIVFRKLKSGK